LNTALLDLNVFVALVWPAHEHHRPAHDWFKSRGRWKWATCPITELGLVRLLSNPAFSPDALSLDQAFSLLRTNLKHPLHEFWPDSIRVTPSLDDLVQHMEGYKQVTDAYLLSLAIRRKARLATFDTGLKQLATNLGKASSVELLDGYVARPRS
jgi:toxin-antitoxin system PIN domain toxin